MENDFSEFESRVSVDALDLEFDTYDMFGARRLRKFFNVQKTMVLRGAGWIFKRRGGRMSGVPNTSIGNSIINFSLHLDFFTRGGFAAGEDYAMAVNGDDMVLYCSVAVYDYCQNQMVA